MTQHIYESVGGMTLPIDPALIDTDTTLAVLDPACATLLALFTQALKSELDATWTTICATLPTDHPLYGSTTIVADALPLEPTDDVMRERVADWPLLCVHRRSDVEATYEERVIGRRDRKQQWYAHLILGSRAGIATDAKLVPMLTRASDVLVMVTERRGHPDYQSGALQFFGGTLAGPHTLAACSVVASGVGNAQFADDDAVYPAMRATLETLETTSDTATAYPQIQGMNMHVAVGDSTGTIPDLVETDTDYPGTMHSDP